MISNTCVAPPVGSGKAGTPSSSTNSTAKLFSPKTAIKPLSVLSPSLSIQRPSSSLTFIVSGPVEDPRSECGDRGIFVCEVSLIRAAPAAR